MFKHVGTRFVFNNVYDLLEAAYMNLQKLNPWNWFKHENNSQNEHQQIPITQQEVQNVGNTCGNSLLHFHQAFNRLFDQMFNAFDTISHHPLLPGHRLFGENTTGSSLLNAYQPQLDIAGDEHRYEIKLNVPGLSQSDLSIEVKNDMLMIKGQKDERSESKDKQYYRIERQYGAFQRTLSLPEDANVDDIKATLKGGVLTLEIPRNPTEDSEVKRIDIAS